MEKVITTKTERGFHLLTDALDKTETELKDKQNLLSKFREKIRLISIDLYDPVDVGQSLGMIAINLASRRESKKFDFAFDLGQMMLSDRFGGKDLLAAKSIFESKFPIDYVLMRNDKA